MKWLVFLLLFTGCGLSSRDKQVILKNATKFCSCHGGLSTLGFMPDVKFGLVFCRNDSRAMIYVDSVIGRCK